MLKQKKQEHFAELVSNDKDFCLKIIIKDRNNKKERSFWKSNLLLAQIIVEFKEGKIDFVYPCIRSDEIISLLEQLECLLKYELKAFHFKFYEPYLDIKFKYIHIEQSLIVIDIKVIVPQQNNYYEFNGIINCNKEKLIEFKNGLMIINKNYPILFPSRNLN